MRYLLFLVLIYFSAIADEAKSLEDYISKNRQKKFKYDYEKNIQESLRLRDSWISPLQLNYSYTKTNPYDNEQTTKQASINLNQSIFRSGGIYYGIKFANASKKYNNYSIDIQKRKLIKDAISLLMQIKQTNLQLKKQNKQIKNAQIKLKQKKEQYLSGQLDSGFLDNAIIQLNLTKQALFDIEANKQRLIAKFQALSDIDYKTAFIPTLKNISKDDFLKHNIVIDLYNTQKQRDKFAKNTTIAKYLPNISINASYINDDNELPVVAGTTQTSTTYYRYGFNISMPLDFNTFRDIQSAKLTYLKSSIEIEDKKRELVALYKQVEENLKNFDKKIDLAQENFEIYDKLLNDTKKLFDAGYKTSYDVELLQNSADMAKLDIEIFKIDKQLELLNLYEYYYFAN